jgi:hypothetical protein
MIHKNNGLISSLTSISLDDQLAIRILASPRNLPILFILVNRFVQGAPFLFLF